MYAGAACVTTSPPTAETVVPFAADAVAPPPLLAGAFAGALPAGALPAGAAAAAASATANAAGNFCPAAQLSNSAGVTVYARMRMLACDDPQYSVQKPFHTIDCRSAFGVYQMW